MASIFLACHTVLLFHKPLGKKEELQEGVQSTKTINKAFKILLPKDQQLKYLINATRLGSMQNLEGMIQKRTRSL